MNVLDLFSGIGGFSLGLERAGMRTVQFVELDPFCRAILAKHWPNVPCHEDVRTFHAPAGFADVICGGFPCQDISVAGRGAGLSGERSGLWTHYARVIGEVRPRYVIVENVSALLHRGVGDVLGDLATLGYDAEWHCIPAATVGAPHRRDRIWVVAYTTRTERGSERGPRGGPRKDIHAQGEESAAGFGGRRAPVADADCERQPQPRGPVIEVWRWLGKRSSIRNLDGSGLPPSGAESIGTDRGQARAMPSATDWWAVEPLVGRMAHGVPARVDRLRSLGNSVVPQIPEIIGKAIMRHANER